MYNASHNLNDILESFSDSQAAVLKMLLEKILCSLLPPPDSLCGLVVRVHGYRTEMYCASCEVRTECSALCECSSEEHCGSVLVKY
jgi:hypothetical protein